MSIYLCLESEGQKVVKIKSCNISRYRSILFLSMDFAQELNMISICGQNNVGKTNALGEINLFFHPENYVPETDMPKIKHATGGQSIHPKIEIVFWDDQKDMYYALYRNLEQYTESSPYNSLSGNSYELKGKKEK